MSDKEKRLRRIFRIVFTVFAVVCAVGGIALFAGLTESGGSDIFGGIALLVVAVVVAVIGWIPWKIKEKLPKPPKEPKSKNKSKKRKLPLDIDNIKVIYIIYTRTYYLHLYFGSARRKVYTCNVCYKDGHTERRYISDGDEYFDSIYPLMR